MGASCTKPGGGSAARSGAAAKPGEKKNSDILKDYSTAVTSMMKAIEEAKLGWVQFGDKAALARDAQNDSQVEGMNAVSSALNDLNVELKEAQGGDLKQSFEPMKEYLVKCDKVLTVDMKIYRKVLQEYNNLSRNLERSKVTGEKREVIEMSVEQSRDRMEVQKRAVEDKMEKLIAEGPQMIEELSLIMRSIHIDMFTPFKNHRTVFSNILLGKEEELTMKIDQAGLLDLFQAERPMTSAQASSTSAPAQYSSPAPAGSPAPNQSGLEAQPSPGQTPAAYPTPEQTRWQSEPPPPSPGANSTPPPQAVDPNATGSNPDYMLVHGAYDGSQQQYGQPPQQQYGQPPQQQYGQPPAQQYGQPPAQQYGQSTQEQYGKPTQQEPSPYQQAPVTSLGGQEPVAQTQSAYPQYPAPEPPMPQVNPDPRGETGYAPGTYAQFTSME